MNSDQRKLAGPQLKEMHWINVLLSQTLSRARRQVLAFWHRHSDAIMRVDFQLREFWQKRAESSSPPPNQTPGRTEIDRCAAEIAGVWRDHHVRVLPAYMRAASLDRQIEQFSAGAFQIIRKYPQLREAAEPHLWMIYFKGLLLSGTHPASEMKTSVRIVADRHLGQ